MKIKIWGSRGSLPSPSPENNYFGGNTSCVELVHEDTLLILDAGSGIRPLGYTIPTSVTRIDILLTHLHLDHIMGLGFFLPIYNPNISVNIWGPSSTNHDLDTRLSRYLSPPLFPVRMCDLPCKLEIKEINHSHFSIGSLNITSDFVTHPGPTLGYRVSSEKSTVAYIPDHEPALGQATFPGNPDWTSGFDLAHEADILLHDAQYTSQEYSTRIGWGHSAMHHALQFAKFTEAKHLLFFHHDPSHTDTQLRQYLKDHLKQEPFTQPLGIAAEGDSFYLP